MSRSDKVNQEIMKHVSKIIHDMFPGTMISVVKVDSLPRMSNVNISLSIFDDQKMKIFGKIRKDKGHIRKELSQKLKIRRTPDIFFKLNDSIEYSRRIADKIIEIKKEGK